METFFNTTQFVLAHGGRSGMGPGGGHHGMGFGFPWLSSLMILLLLAAIVFLVLRWFRGRSKEKAMTHFLEASYTSPSYATSVRGNQLDDWEQSLKSKGDRTNGDS